MTDGERGIIKSIVRRMDHVADRAEDAVGQPELGDAEALRKAAYMKAAEFESVLWRLKELLGEGEDDAVGGE